MCSQKGVLTIVGCTKLFHNDFVLFVPLNVPFQHFNCELSSNSHLKEFTLYAIGRI